MKTKNSKRTNRKRQRGLPPATCSAQRCEGWIRHGGAFTLGPVTWSQCDSIGLVMLKVKQDGKVQTMPACQECWNECIKNGITIIEARPIAPNESSSPTAGGGNGGAQNKYEKSN